MDTLTEFLLDCFAEDEAVAKAASTGPWKVNDETYAETIYAADGYTTVVAGGKWGGEASVFDDTADAIHIALHDPARVLAECEAKRLILALSEHGCGDDYERVQRALALPYADRPGYQQKWKP